MTASFAFLIESQSRTHITRIHLRQAFRQIRPIQQGLIPQLIPQILAEIPILASGTQVAEKAQDRMQTLRVEEQARPQLPGGKETIFHPCADGLITHEQNPGCDGNADWFGRRQRTVGHVD